MAILKKIKSKNNKRKKVFRTPFSFEEEKPKTETKEPKKKSKKKQKRQIKNGRLLILPEEKRTKCVSVMLNPLESKKLILEAKKLGISKSNYVRLLLQKDLKAKSDHM